MLSLIVSGAGLAKRNIVVSPTSQRYALVIGNDSYLRVNKLDNARADARAMARALERAGFTVILKLDAGRAEMLETVRSFKTRLTGGSEAVFFSLATVCNWTPQTTCCQWISWRTTRSR